MRAVNNNGATVKISVSYPKTANVPPDGEDALFEKRDATASDPLDQAERDEKWRVTEGCDVWQGDKKRDQAACFLSKNGRLFEIYDALDTSGDGYSGTVTVRLRLKNPDDNWGAVGFKIRTYEVVPGKNGRITSLVDRLDGEDLRPVLQCDRPCYECREDEEKKTRVSLTSPGGKIEVEKWRAGECTRCWQDRPEKYLMPLDAAGNKGDVSNCTTTCGRGWTTNGDTTNHECERCAPEC